MTTTANGEQFLELCKAVVEAAREGEDTYRQGVPYLHECTGNMVRGIEVEAVEIGRPKPLTVSSATQRTNFDTDVDSPKQKENE